MWHILQTLILKTYTPGLYTTLFLVTRSYCSFSYIHFLIFANLGSKVFVILSFTFFKFLVSTFKPVIEQLEII
ncbi:MULTISPECIES: hypothetical protein [unclassified Lysinibacillus]|uniref:hypothetical protein n=1 Tax=unclassified Lysinibacillus TaxID=2636778 RepID=UPI00382C0A1D